MINVVNAGKSKFKSKKSKNGAGSQVQVARHLPRIIEDNLRVSLQRKVKSKKSKVKSFSKSTQKR